MTETKEERRGDGQPAGPDDEIQEPTRGEGENELEAEAESAAAMDADVPQPPDADETTEGQPS